jgi:hypothetical protein
MVKIATLFHESCQGGCIMKAAIIFTGTGPILILTSYESVTDPLLVRKLSAKGIKKFIAYDVPIDLVKQKYGAHFLTVMNDVKETDDLRVLDYNGHNVFYNFNVSRIRRPTFFEPEAEAEAVQF